MAELSEKIAPCSRLCQNYAARECQNTYGPELRKWQCILVHILNRSTNKKCPSLTSDERWFGKKPDLGHIRFLGILNVLYMCRGKTERKKWDPKAKKMFLVGYESTVKNYRLYDPAATFLTRKSSKEFRWRV